MSCQVVLIKVRLADKKSSVGNDEISKLMSTFSERSPRQFGYPDNLILAVLKLLIDIHRDLAPIFVRWGNALKVRERKGNEWEIRFDDSRIAIKVPKASPKSLRHFC